MKFKNYTEIDMNKRYKASKYGIGYGGRDIPCISTVSAILYTFPSSETKPIFSTAITLTRNVPYIEIVETITDQISTFFKGSGICSFYHKNKILRKYK